MISFEDTQKAFAGKDDKTLKRSWWLFKLVGNPFLVNTGKVLTNAALAIRFPISGMIKATIFRQFVGGETIQECDRTIGELKQFGIGTILDYSVEGKTEEKDFDATTSEIIRTIERAKGDPAIPFSVFKVTGIAGLALLEKVSKGAELSEQEGNEFQRVRERVNSICSRAALAGVPVFIDAEESWIQQAIDDLADEMMAKYNYEKAIVYNTFQLYRKDRLEFLKNSWQKAGSRGYFLGAKLVRGAYMEKERKRASDLGYPSPIHDSKDDTDRDYDAAVAFCLEHYERIALCAGTHNEKSSMILARLIQERKIDPKHPHLYFSQLLGMSDHISYNLSDAGYNVAKYVPYGPVREVLPYLIRRAMENTSVKGQTGRELSLINKEIARRRGV